MLIAASAVFLIRGPLLASDPGDLAPPFVSAVRFLHGQDPYAVKNFRRDWYADGIGEQVFLNNAAQHPVYPPSALVVLMPFAASGWRAGVYLYLWGCSALYLVIIWLLSIEIRCPRTDWRRVLFIAFALSLGPMLTGISKGNLTVLSLLLGLFCTVLAHREWPIWAGLALGTACAIKPTVGVAFVVFFLLGGEVRLLAATFASGAALIVAGILRLHALPAWKAHYAANVAFFFGPGGDTSWHSNSAKRFDLLNLQLPIWDLTHSIRFSNIAAWMIVGVLGAVWVCLAWQLRSERRNWAPLAACTLLSLLPIYQRNYNAGALLLAFLWAFQHLDRRSARAVLALSIVALFPVEGFLRNKAYPHMTAVQQNTLPWRFLIMPELTWVILLIILCLLAAMAAEVTRRRAAQRQPPSALDNSPRPAHVSLMQLNRNPSHALPSSEQLRRQLMTLRGNRT